MAKKFLGTPEELATHLESVGYTGKWSDDGAGKHTFRCDDGAVLNWWRNKGTVQVQGPPTVKERLEGAFSSPSAPRSASQSPTATQVKRQIFIVHGHDASARDQLELALRRLSLDPFVLMNESGSGKTLIEALEGKIGRDFSADFGIVLMTPDDVGYAKKDGPDKAEPRARQNVVLETGMLLSSLTRERMAIVVKGHVELPSDLLGIIRFAYNDHIREIVPKLCQRLKEAGFGLGPDQIAAAAQ
jgi:predicted nucleotide-binding protein